MRNRLGLLLVVLYYAHCIAAMTHVATMDDAKGQAVWLSAPLWLTPPVLLDLMPDVTLTAPDTRWHLQTLVRLPVAFLFTSILMFVAGLGLTWLWKKGLGFATAVGTLLGLGVGMLWFLLTGSRDEAWFLLSLAGGGLSALVYRASRSRAQPDRWL
ncbi:hypothetical protein [Nitrogeniibacter aestuarii]|uniref:hypothetical protein n=1 Tax=Nitrogeniibacter aestuarii TaxID=2815343 RepID=UPI001E2C0575|nr:hypothetical protein [Nitrogeniibacter aestuarii]